MNSRAMDNDDSESINLKLETERTVLEIALRDHIAELLKGFQAENNAPIKNIFVELSAVPIRSGCLRTFVRDVRVVFFTDRLKCV